MGFKRRAIEGLRRPTLEELGVIVCVVAAWGFVAAALYSVVAEQGSDVALVCCGGALVMTGVAMVIGHYA